MRSLLRIQFVAAALGLLVAPVPAQQVNPTIVVPQLIGRTPAQARDTLARLGLVLAAIDTTSSNAGAAAGRIVDQKPAAGSKAVRGTRVSVVVAVQPPVTPPPIQVPDVIGLSLGEASQRLAAARLKPGSTSERDQFDKPAGVVLEQKPRAGDPAPRAGTVDLLLASDWTEVPSLK
ncbi:MAG: PASTA domain-containing protein, partial [Longimicrobiales bacterium]